ncbi:MAG: aminodeoxychorismate synthase component I [Candidatus Omnitrophica bacterium]|nr:aminodeoxychorismate synthase component I [Candidatus Omnitrophota bacterium]
MAYCILRSYKLKLRPEDIFAALARKKKVFFLDSSLTCDRSRGRYSFLGFDPFQVFRSKGEDSFPALRKIVDGYACAASRLPLPFLGGAVGFLSYDVGFRIEEKVRQRSKEEIDVPDFYFAFYNSAIIIDHLKKRMFLCALGVPERKDHAGRLLAEKNFKILYQALSEIPGKGSLPTTFSGKSVSGLSSNFTREQYCRAVRRAKEYIRKGDIYQVNLSQRFVTQSLHAAPLIYQRLRRVSPSYFSAYLDAGDFQIISSSPERFLRVEGKKIITRPMKGTRPRSAKKEKDRFFKEELLKSRKDKAELTMIVDLERNDLGRVCEYNSVNVRSLRLLETYRTVYQTTAIIEGQLARDKDRIDALRACSPGGSITGCPKIRAMEIIEELEPTRRSIYTGCLGYLGFHGGMEFNILIRTMLKKGSTLSFGAGGGIVADSVPEEEYQETLVKAVAMRETMRG